MRLRRSYSSSAHAGWYTQILPSMVPVAILASSVYLGVHLVQTTLVRERYADLASARIAALESELSILRQRHASDNIAKAPQTRTRRRWWLF